MFAPLRLYENQVKQWLTNESGKELTYGRKYATRVKTEVVVDALRGHADVLRAWQHGVPGDVNRLSFPKGLVDLGGQIKVRLCWIVVDMQQPRTLVCGTDVPNDVSDVREVLCECMSSLRGTRAAWCEILT